VQVPWRLERLTKVPKKIKTNKGCVASASVKKVTARRSPLSPALKVTEGILWTSNLQLMLVPTPIASSSSPDDTHADEQTSHKKIEQETGVIMEEAQDGHNCC
jgi:hypothetical protein